MSSLEALSQKVSAAFADRTKLKEADYVAAVRETLARLDAGELRVAEKGPEGWRVNAWVKEAILLFFAVSEMQVMEVGPFEFHDKVPLKKSLRGGGRARGAPGRGALRRLRGAGRGGDARLREHRRARGRGHDGGHLGHGGQLRAGGPQRPPVRRRGPGRGARAAHRLARSSSRTAPSSAAAASSSRAWWWRRRRCSAPTWCSPRPRRSSTSPAPRRRSTRAGCRRAAWSSPGCARSSSPPASTACRAR